MSKKIKKQDKKQNEFIQEYLYIEDFYVPIKKIENKYDEEDKDRGSIIIEIF